MMSEYLEPEKKQDDKRPEKDKSLNTNAGVNTERKDKRARKHFKVLHEDGSFADLPDSNEQGGGALEGTVGIGT